MTILKLQVNLTLGNHKRYCTTKFSKENNENIKTKGVKKMRLNNKTVIDKMCMLIRENLSLNDFKRYIKTFHNEYDFNIFQYGNLDIYDYDLYKRLDEFGVTTKAVTEYAKVLDSGCTYKHRENIRQAYKHLVRRAAQKLCFQIRYEGLGEDDFIK